MDVADQSAIEHGFGFEPEIIAAFVFALRIRDQGCYQFQDVLF